MSIYIPYSLPKSSVAVASINNVLSMCDFPWLMSLGTKTAALRPIFSPLPPAYSSILTLNVGDDVFYIALQEAQWHLLHKALEDIEDPQDISLPEQLEQAILENLASPLLNSLSNLFEVNIGIMESFVQNSAHAFSHDILQEKNYRLCFAFNVDYEQYSTAKDFFVDIWIPKNYDINGITNKLRKLPISKQDFATYLEDVPIYISFELGYVSLSQQSLLACECGDVLLADKMFIQNASATSRVRLVISSQTINKTHSFTYGSMQDNIVTVLEGWRMIELEENLENVAQSIADEENMQDGEESLSIAETIDSLEVLVSFELERRTMKLQDAKNITNGYTFALECSKDSPVTLRVNGKKIGMGKLVDMDGLLGVEVVIIG